MSDVLSAADLATALDSRRQWSGDPSSIERTVEAPDVVDDAEVAEQANHHPDIDIRWRRVRFALVTHDAGGVTDLDLDLVAHIDAIAAAHRAT